MLGAQGYFHKKLILFMVYFDFINVLSRNCSRFVKPKRFFLAAGARARLSLNNCALKVEPGNAFVMRRSCFCNAGRAKY